MDRKNISTKKRQYIYARDNFKCQYCGVRVNSDNLHLDHLVPHSRGGDDSEMNLITSCEKCNLKKGSLLLPVPLIREYQEGIIQRTIEYEKHLSKYPIKQNKESIVSYKRPTQLLSDYPKIKELLKGRSVHPEKEHHLIITIKEKKIIRAKYNRLYKNKWESVVEYGEGFYPLTIDEYEKLSEETEFHLIDKTPEIEGSVEIYTNKEGLYLILSKYSDAMSFIYSFWAKPMSLKVHIDILVDDFLTHDRLLY